MDERRNPIVSGSLIAFALVIAYVLSIGPAKRLQYHASARAGSEWSTRLVLNLYAPVWVVASKTHTTKYVYAYIDWWVPD